MLNDGSANDAESPACLVWSVSKSKSKAQACTMTAMADCSQVSDVDVAAGVSSQSFACLWLSCAWHINA